MLDERVEEAWRARQRRVPISVSPTFASEGLVLGAGIVLVEAEGERRLKSIRGHEPRVLALLIAAYGKSIRLSVLGNVARAAKAWREGDDCLADVHLAHAGLHPLDNMQAVRWLLLADGAMRAGASAGDAVRDREEVERAPQRSSLLGRMPLPAASFLSELDAAQVAELAAYASRLLGPAGAAATAAAAVFGLLFIPSSNNVRVEGEAPEIPGLRYSWNRDESQLYLTYSHANGGQRTFALHLDGDDIRDENGNIVGRIIDGNPEEDGEPVSYDDCQKKTDTLFDYKGEGYAALLQNPIIEDSIKEKFRPSPPASSGKRWTSDRLDFCRARGSNVCG